MVESVDGAHYGLMRAETELNRELSSREAIGVGLGEGLSRSGLFLQPLFVSDEQFGRFHPDCGDTVRAVSTIL